MYELHDGKKDLNSDWILSQDSMEEIYVSVREGMIDTLYGSESKLSNEDFLKKVEGDCAKFL